MKKQLLLITALFFGGVANAQYFSDDFSGGNLNGYTIFDVVPSTSTLSWVWGTGGGADFAKMSNWNGTGNEVVETWLITPSINLSTSTNPTLTFDNTKRYGTNDVAVELDVLVSTDYDGSSDPTAQGTWTEITASVTLDTDVNSWTFVNSGDLDLSTVITPGANTYIAFKYMGSATDGNTWEIDNINVTEGVMPTQTLTIYDIQYTTDAAGFSPHNGEEAIVKGLVVAQSSNAFNANDRGYWIQDGSGPWNGIFVWDSVNVVNRGDSVEVLASINENFNQTILHSVSNVTILNSGNTEPAGSVITSDQVNTEEYEGVLVTVEQATCINPNIGFGQWSINNATTDALVDDVMYEFLTPALGEAYTVTGVVYYTYTEYKVLPRDFNDVQTVTGLNELSNEVLEVYPNPTNGVINLNNKGQVVNVYNTVGQNVLSTTDSSFELTTGAYIVKVGSKVARVVVK